MKLWDKGIKVNDKVERFTVGKDREMDLYLAPFDVLGTMAHITMLESVGLLQKNELDQLLSELQNIYTTTLEGNFKIEDGIEDVHSQVEMMLTERLGDIGKKVHSGRSRNDQVLLDLKLFIRKKIEEVVEAVQDFFGALQTQSENYKDYLIPGYTHLQVAMPSSFGLWFGAYAESLTDDMQMLKAAWKITNQNPLGAAAGYGSSFPLNRQLTTSLLGFDNMNYNVVYAQMGRGKTEKNVAMALSSVAYTVGKFAMDACLYMSQNFGFLTLPGELTTGSSIMPHKKNPDVFELIRAKCNQIQALPESIGIITGNLPSGYFRDLQLIKENFLPAFDELISCLDLATFAVNNITIKKDVLQNEMYKYAFSVEEVNKLVLQGIPFRDAYKQIGKMIEDGAFDPEINVAHTHEGSIGNLCNQQVQQKMEGLIDSFNFEKVNKALKSLLELK
ncbi:argininosuccinate lyase [Saccharicrinis fermentans]|uniref:Argininosuccinate lyase n=1 Tax=Saccharicrinis fermentans DSM 9555 = JCM 21142 TaxID=869213 RepID=W7YR41_9BACT|nr:argininosuccinate lyase [Saccharicrinis fermentans]GAF04904.1 argininosuccinate lyase [Saccharicrinis fermentans DSM 9555 = JCM 21142]